MNNAIVTFYQKKYKGILDVAIPRLKNYASKCNAKLIEIQFEDTQLNPQMEKFFHIGNSLEGYDRFLIIDIDILIRNDAPNIFDIVPDDKFAAYNEGASFHNSYGTKHDEIQVRFQNIWEITNDCKLPKINLHYEFTSEKPFIYMNSGVVVLSRQHLFMYSKYKNYKKPLFESKVVCSEQALVNHAIYWQKPSLYHLPQCFNQMGYNRMSDYLWASYFSHYAGVSLEQKIKEMVADDKKWESMGF